MMIILLKLLCAIVNHFCSVKKPHGQKKTRVQFDKTMVSFDGAEICEFAGLFLQHQLFSILDQDDVGLYRDDGFAVLRNSSGPAASKIRKIVTKAFLQHDLRVTIDTNSVQTVFLDVTLNLSSKNTLRNRMINVVNQNLAFIHINLSSITQNR